MDFLSLIIISYCIMYLKTHQILPQWSYQHPPIICYYNSQCYYFGVFQYFDSVSSQLEGFLKLWKLCSGRNCEMNPLVRHYYPSCHHCCGCFQCCKEISKILQQQFRYSQRHHKKIFASRKFAFHTEGNLQRFQRVEGFFV